MADYDIIIKGGTVVDGTRTPRYVSDIAIKDGKIAQIGGLIGKTAERVLDAAGRIVAPGFVDLHTHYDGRFSGIRTARFPGGTGSPRWPWAIAGSGSPRPGSRTAIGQCSA